MKLHNPFNAANDDYYWDYKEVPRWSEEEGSYNVYREYVSGYEERVSRGITSNDPWSIPRVRYGHTYDDKEFSE